MPDGSAYFIFQWFQRNTATGPVFSSRLVLVGHRSVYTEVNRQHRLLTLLIRFQPGGVAPFLPFPVAELTDRSISIRELWGNRGAALQQRAEAIAADGGYLLLFDLFEQALLDRQTGSHALHPVLHHGLRLINSHHGKLPVKSLCEKSSVSDRYLRRLFRQQVGLSPKRLRRITRIRWALYHTEKDWPFGWAGLAVNTGYYDQAHLIDEFQALLGTSPENFLARTSREDLY
jgi:AraC-like DNA-binding protein